MREHGLFIAGRWLEGSGTIAVRSPYDGREVARVARADAEHLRTSLDAAAGARDAMRALPPHARAAILERAAAEVAKRREELANVMVEEAGKPLTLARGEAERCGETFGEAARVARSPHAELLDLEGFPSGAGRMGLIRRYPVGVVVRSSSSRPRRPLRRRCSSRRSCTVPGCRPAGSTWCRAAARRRGSFWKIPASGS
jgi:aldehyde dehydrogenase (NAD+)/glyceraldehyde-3-phosphate dehydrogenase (NADP+)